MSPQARTRAYALLVVGEAVVIFVLAAALLLQGSGEAGLEYETDPAARTGVAAPVSDQGLRADADIRQPHAAEASSRRTQDSASERMPIKTPEQYTPEDPVGLVVYGAVLDPGGKPLERARLRLTSLASGRGLNATFYKNSGYAVTGLQPGPWRISVTATGYHPISRTIQLAPSPARVRLDFHVRSAVKVDVAVRTPDGKPLRAEMISNGISSVRPVVQAFAGDPGTRFPSGLAGLDTNYNSRSRWMWQKKLPGADGSLEVLIEPPCFVALLVGEVVLDCKPLTGNERLMTLTASLENVRAALGSVLVNVSSSDGSPLTEVRVYTDTARTSRPIAAGSSVYRLQYVRPGLHRLIVTARGRGNVYRSVRIESGKELEVDVLLDSECKIQGQVVGPEGPLEGVSVRMYPLDPKAPANQRFRAGTDSKGEFEIDHLSTGDYHVVAGHREKRLYGLSRVTVRPGHNRLPPVTVAGAGKLVVEASTLPPGDWYYIRIGDLRGRVLHRRSFDLRGTSLVLPPGRHAYKIVDRQGQTIRTGTVMIGSEPVVLAVH